MFVEFDGGDFADATVGPFVVGFVGEEHYLGARFEIEVYLGGVMFAIELTVDVGVESFVAGW